MSFPVEILSPAKAGIHSLLRPNQKGGVDLRYGVDLELQPAKLLDEEQARSRTITVSHMPLNGAKDWRKISGTYEYGADELNGAIPIANMWHPVDVRRINVDYLGGGKFKVTCDLFLALEVWGSGYDDASATIEFDAQFTGLKLQTQNFSEDTGIDDLNAFLAKHVDVAAYDDLTVDDTVVTFTPKTDD